MVDLQGQYQKIKSEVDRHIQEVINSAAFIKGPEFEKFKSELESYLQVKHVIPCANGTDALQVCLMALGLKPGDEIITTSFTFVATAEVIALLGLKPVLVDCDYDTFLIDTEAMEKAITANTRAIIPVHLFGQCANMEEIMKVAKKHNLYVIEDGAQSIGAKFYFSDGSSRTSGTIGDFGTTSFFPSKNLGCYGDGGAIYTNNDVLAEKVAMIVNHGMKKRYYHDEIGLNSRLDSIQATILRVKLKYLDEYNSARQKAAAFYDEAFQGIDELILPKRVENSDHIFHQYTMKVNGIDRDLLREDLMNKGVPAMVYYPVPMHLQKAYQDNRYKEGDFPVSEQLASQVLSLPMHTELDEEQLTYITEMVKSAIKNNHDLVIENKG